MNLSIQNLVIRSILPLTGQLGLLKFTGTHFVIFIGKNCLLLFFQILFNFLITKQPFCKLHFICKLHWDLFSHLLTLKLIIKIFKTIQNIKKSHESKKLNAIVVLFFSRFIFLFLQFRTLFINNNSFYNYDHYYYYGYSVRNAIENLTNFFYKLAGKKILRIKTNRDNMYKRWNFEFINL